MTNPARELELARLVAEQQADDTGWVKQRDRSLDAALSDDDGSRSLYEIVADDERQTSSMRGVRGRVTAKQRKEWRWLRTEKGWTYQQIADYAGVNWKTVRKHCPQRGGRYRAMPCHSELLKRKEQVCEMYEAGATLLEIAEVIYRECGYKSPSGCRQSLRSLLLAEGVELRPRAFKHGACMRSAPPEVRAAYKRSGARKRRRTKLKPCAARTKTGGRCMRWALPDESLCVSHSRHPQKWNRDSICTAIRRWEETHGQPPRTTQWVRAGAWHPNNTTVYDHFASWADALDAADALFGGWSFFRFSDFISELLDHARSES